MVELQRQIRDILDRLERLEKPDVGIISTTYTPTYVGGTTPGVTTYSLQQGVYIRCGKLVVATGAVVWTNATGTGTARISLPVAGASGVNQSGSIRLVDVTFASGTPQVEFAGTDYFTMRSPATNAGGTAVAIEVAGNIIFSIVYLID